MSKWVVLFIRNLVPTDNIVKALCLITLRTVGTNKMNRILIIIFVLLLTSSCTDISREQLYGKWKSEHNGNQFDLWIYDSLAIGYDQKNALMSLYSLEYNNQFLTFTNISPLKESTWTFKLLSIDSLKFEAVLHPINTNGIWKYERSDQNMPHIYSDYLENLKYFEKEKIFDASEKIYKLINAIIKTDSIKPFGSKNIRLLDSIPSYPYNDIFDDIEHVKKYSQFEIISEYVNELSGKPSELVSYRINPQKLDGIEVVSSSSIDLNASFEENRDVKPFYMIYSPILSSDGKIAIVSIDLVCFGLCGEGWTLILHYNNGKWTKIGKVLGWIS